MVNNEIVENVGQLQGSGVFNYGTGQTITATVYPGYDWIGWFEGENKIADGAVTARKIADGAVTVEKVEPGVFYHTGNKPTAADIGALATAGGTVWGQMFLNDAGSGTRRTMLTTYDNITHMRHEGEGGDMLDLMLSMEHGFIIGVNQNGSYNNFAVFHQGNKPTGTYTGDSTGGVKTINVGGIGKLLLITSTMGMVILSSEGGFGKGSSSTGDAQDGGLEMFASTEACFNEGQLIFSSGSGILNHNGVTYTYQVL